MSTDLAFEPGQIVYTADGSRAEYVTKAGGNHIVRLSYTTIYGDEEEEYFEGLAEERHIYEKPPVAQRHEEVVSLEAKAAELRTKIMAFHNELREKEASAKAVIEKCSRAAGLKDLEAFIDGKMTHFVVVNYHKIYIKTKDETLNDEGRYSKGVRLLSLFGDSKGNLSWNLNRYNDGSGSWEEVYPALSYEDAKAKAAELLETTWAEAREGKTHLAAYGVESAKRLGLPIPDDMAAIVRSVQEKVARDAVERAEEALKKAQATLSAVAA